MAAIRKIKSKSHYTYDDYKYWEDSEDWEIINGEAYNMAPSPVRKHQEIASRIHGEIQQYLKDKPCKVYFELDVVLSQQDIVKPDLMIVCDKDKLTERNISGAPDFVVEILSPSTSIKDKGLKYHLYKQAGVKEYWIVDPYNYTIDVHNFVTNEFNYRFYDAENDENFLEPSIFNGDFKIDINYIFEE